MKKCLIFCLYKYQGGENYMKKETKQFISSSYGILNNKISITFIILSVIIPFVLNVNFDFKIIDNDNLRIICKILFIASIILIAFTFFLYIFNLIFLNYSYSEDGNAELNEINNETYTRKTTFLHSPSSLKILNFTRSCTQGKRKRVGTTFL